MSHGREQESKSRQNLPDDLVIVAGKPIEQYVFSVLLRFETMKQVKLSATMYHTPKAERIISLFEALGVEQIHKQKNGNRIEWVLARA